MDQNLFVLSERDENIKKSFAQTIDGHRLVSGLVDAFSAGKGDPPTDRGYASPKFSGFP
jgi:hypothetical protein